MKGKIKILIGVGLAVLTDAGTGIIVVHLMGKLFHYEPLFYFYLVGVFFSLLPDADLFLMKIGIVKDHHQLLSHYPLMFIPMTCLLVVGVSRIAGVAHSWFWVSVTGPGLFFHYLDDSWSRTSGIGLRWLMPWDDKYYSFCPVRVLTDGEVEKMALPSPEQWVKYHYLRITPELLLGVVIFLASIAIALFW